MRNIGNATANCGSICNQEVDFFLDGSKLPGDGNYDNLAAGSSVIVQSRSYTAPAAGTHNFRALADADGDISESNDRNNDRSENLTVAQAPKPDLIVEDIWLDPTTPTEGSSYRIKARVRNIGNAAANCGSICNQEVDFFLDGSKLPGDGNYDNLAAGSSVIVQSRSYTAPAASTHNFRALADADGDISESNDRNNDRSENLTVAQAPKPDLIVEDIWLEPASPVEGTSYRVKARVKNIGEARATCPGTCNQEIFFYVNNVNVGEDNYDNLDPNQIITLESPRLTAPSAGSHAIRAKADANNEVPESRESNNELSEPFTTNPVTYTLKTFTDTEATVYLNGSQIGVTSRRTACNLFYRYLPPTRRPLCRLLLRSRKCVGP